MKKYKTGVNEILRNFMKLISSAGRISLKLSSINTEITIVKIVSTISQNKLLGILSVISSPSLLKNLPLSLVSFLVKVVKLNLCNTNPKIKIDGINPILTAPIVTPTANIRFQKLSLFVLDSIKPLVGFRILSVATGEMTTGLVSAFIGLRVFVKSCIITTNKFRFKIYKSIVPLITLGSKALMLIVAGSLISFYGTITMANFPENPPENEIKKIIDLAELKHDIPLGLLAAIAKVESDFVPYALNVEGKSIDVKSPEEAKGKIKKIVAAGITSFDVGVMQINYRWHHKEFTDAAEMLEPKANVEYAAKLLKGLYGQHGDWHKAVRYYHSSTPLHHKKYSRKIITAWIEG